MKFTNSRPTPGSMAATGTVQDAFTRALGNAYPDFAPNWVRPADWLALPAVNATDEKIVGLVAVYPNKESYVGFTTSVAVQVNWGDGSAVQNVAAGASVYKNYDDTVAGLVGSDCSRGYKQAIVTITPTSGGFGTLTMAYGGWVTTNYGQNAWLDFKIASQTCTQFSFGGYASSGTPGSPMLEQAGLILPACAAMSSLFSGCSSLRSISRLDYGAVTNMSYWFNNCYSLEAIVPQLNCTGVTTFASMFNGCMSLKTPPALSNTGSVVTASSMFQGCTAMRTAPAMDTRSIANWTMTFYNCRSLLRIPDYNYAAATSLASTFQACSSIIAPPNNLDAATLNTTLVSTFQDCTSLKTAPLLCTDNVTQLQQTFYNCYALTTFPTGTAGAALNLLKATTLQGMFYYCQALKSVPALNIPKVTSLSMMFQNCDNLESVGDLTTSAVLTSMGSAFQLCRQLLVAPNISVTSAVTSWSSAFDSCSRLQKVPLYDFSGATTVAALFNGCVNLVDLPALNFTSVAAGNFNNTFSGCYALARLPAVNIKGTISVQNCPMNGPNLNTLFNGLATTSGQTITINNTPGAQAGSGIDRTIATNKGWTVNG